MDIKVHKTDLPEDLNVGNRVAVDCEFMGLNFQRDKLCLVQISSGNSDAHIVQLDRNEYKAPILKKILSDKSIKKIFHYSRSDLTFIKRRKSYEEQEFGICKIKRMKFNSPTNL